MLVRTLLLLIQMMYLAFYIGALANLTEIDEIFLETGLPHPAAVMSLLVTTAAVLIPVRLFIVVAVALDFQNLPSKFSRLFPVLLILDLVVGGVAIPSDPSHQHRPRARIERPAGLPAVRAALPGSDVLTSR